MLCLNISNIVIIIVKVLDSHCIIHEISKSGVIPLLKMSLLEHREYIQKMHIQEINIKSPICNYYFGNLVGAK